MANTHASLAGRVVEIAPGLALTLGIAAIASIVGRLIPLVGSAVTAIVIGILIALVRRPSSRLLPGIRFSSGFVLQLSVVLLGTQLSLAGILEVGLSAVPVMLSTLAVCLVGAWWLGRRLAVPRRLATLIGVGTGICGASAIAAVAPVIGALGGEIAYALSTIFVFNILAVLTFPALGHALGLDPHTFGLLAGTAVNDTSSVVAAASAFGAASLGYAVVVKLVRTLMIIPISIGLSVVEARQGRAPARRGILRLVPWFLIGFVVVAVLNSLITIPDAAHGALTSTSVFLIATALAGIGLSTDLRALRAAGWRPLILGGIVWILVTATAIGVIALLGGLA